MRWQTEDRCFQAYKEWVSIGPAFSIEYWREASCQTSKHFNPSTATCVLNNLKFDFQLKSEPNKPNIEVVNEVCLMDTSQNGGICKGTSGESYEFLCKEEFTWRNCTCKPIYKSKLKKKLLYFENIKVSLSTFFQPNHLHLLACCHAP